MQADSPSGGDRILIMIKTVFLTVFFLNSYAVAAESSIPPTQTADFLTVVDKNGDGQVDKKEFFTAMEKKFRSLDVDKSDTVSMQELKVYGEKDPRARQTLHNAALETVPVKILDEEAFIKLFTDRAEQEFSSLDKNHDNELTAAELGGEKKSRKKRAKSAVETHNSVFKEDFVADFVESAERKFAELDKNYDDELDNAELGVPKAQIKAVFPTLSLPADAKNPAENESSESQKLIRSLFVGIDSNHDALISPAEKKAAFERLFNRLDSNHDELITAAEITQGRHKSAPDTP